MLAAEWRCRTAHLDVHEARQAHHDRVPPSVEILGVWFHAGCVSLVVPNLLTLA